MSNNKLFISIMMPARNEDKHVGAVIDSLQKSIDGNRHPYEIIVVDDGSVDRTADEVRARAARDPYGRVRLLRNEINVGPTAARNIASENARESELVLFTEPHTYIESELLNWVSEIERLEKTVLPEHFILTCVAQEYDPNSPSHVGSAPIYGHTFPDESLIGNAQLEYTKTVGQIPPDHRNGLNAAGYSSTAGFMLMPSSTYYGELGGFFYGGRKPLIEDGEISLRAWAFGIPILCTRNIRFLHSSNPKPRSSNSWAQKKQFGERIGDAYQFCYDYLAIAHIYFDGYPEKLEKVKSWHHSHYPQAYEKAISDLLREDNRDFWDYYDWVQARRVHDSRWFFDNVFTSW